MPITEPVYQPDNEFASAEDDAFFGVLIGVRLIGAPQSLVHAIGLHAAVYLNECIYWQAKVGENGWFGRTVPQMTEETGLSKHEQAKARESLRDLGLIEEKKGAGFRTKTRVNPVAFRAMSRRISASRKSAAGIQRLEIEQLAAEYQPLAAGNSTAQVTYKEQTKQEDISTESDENAISLIESAPSSVSDRLKINPYGYYEAYCNGRGIKPDALSGGPLQRELHTAKLIMQDGISARDVHDCAAWLQSQEWWRAKGITMNDIRTQFARWVGLNRPLAQKAPGSTQVKGSTPRI